MAPTKVDWLHKLRGTVVCIASGPSLTPEDCELVRASGLATVVTNTTYRLAPWATVLMAHDSKWWDVHGAEVKATFHGHKVAGVRGGERHGAQSLALLKFRPYANSGAAAISLAVLAGSRKVIMLGYDCQHTGGKTHWHGNHPAPLGNAGSVARWPAKFKQLAEYASRHRCQVLNASRETALTCFPRVRLEEALEEFQGANSQHVLKAEPARADATDRETSPDASPRGGAMGVGQAAAAAPILAATHA